MIQYFLSQWSISCACVCTEKSLLNVINHYSPNLYRSDIYINIFPTPQMHEFLSFLRNLFGQTGWSIGNLTKVCFFFFKLWREERGDTIEKNRFLAFIWEWKRKQFKCDNYIVPWDSWTVSDRKPVSFILLQLLTRVPASFDFLSLNIQ